MNCYEPALAPGQRRLVHSDRPYARYAALDNLRTTVVREQYSALFSVLMKAGKMGRGGLSGTPGAAALRLPGHRGCAGSHRQHGGARAGGGRGSLSFALPPGATPNWLLPISLPGFTRASTGRSAAELYVPLYLYSGASGAVGPDDAASAATAARYAPDGRS